MRFTHPSSLCKHGRLSSDGLCNAASLSLLQAKVSPNFKSSYSETLAKLENQYCKLLVSLSSEGLVALFVCV